MKEYFDIYDKNRKLTGKKILRGEKMSDDEYHIFIQVWFKNKKGELLVQKRSAFVSKPHRWCASGGNVQSGESSFLAATREMKEELGIDITTLQGGLFDTRIYQENNQNYFCDSYLFYLDKPLEEFMLQKEEVEEVKYMSMDEIITLMNQGEFFIYWLDYLDKLKKTNLLN